MVVVVKDWNKFKMELRLDSHSKSANPNILLKTIE